ncbi:MAG: Protein required for ethanol metabolism [Chaenotheca gracillima]|nr:MAG: Protein required for ethanol metabolism [Chaenotheca gracillima]
METSPEGPLELHTWGPAFGLPSFDAQCIAAIGYLTQTVPAERWVLIPSNSSRSSTTSSSLETNRNQSLPALRNGANWISGFSNIVEYLREFSQGDWDLDAGLNSQRKADCIAFSSFLESQGQPLLDLSLFVSSDNYTGLTRAELSRLFPWPIQYITPPALRSSAKARSAHLGLSALDIDSAEAEADKHDQQRTRSQIPPSLLRQPRETVSNLLGQPQHASKIRLDALTTNWLDPLHDLLGQKRYLLSESSLSSLDCLAFAYLALAVYPDVPQSWLRETLRSRFRRLEQYTQNLRAELFGDDEHQHSLPWQTPAHLGVLRIATALGSTALESLPIPKHLLDSSSTSPLQTLTLTTTAAAAALLSYMLYTSPPSAFTPTYARDVTFYPPSLQSSAHAQSFQGRGEHGVPEQDAKLQTLGEAGAALSFLADQMDREVDSQRETERNRSAAR